MSVVGNRKLRLTHVVLSLGAGGTERLVIDLCKGLLDVADLQVLCLDELGVWSSELVDAGVPVTRLGREPGFDWGLIRRVRTHLAAHQSDVVHCHHYTPYIYGGLGALGTRTKVIYTEHGRLTDEPWTTKRRIANGIFGRLPGQFYAVSDNLREHMVDGGMPDHRVKVIYNGIPPLEIPDSAARLDARARMGIDPEAYVLGTVARLDPVKDLPTLVEAYARFREQYQERNAVLAIVGDGDERGALEAAVAKQGLNDSVVFLGHRNDARALLAGFDVYVNCSLTEGVSVTILEAMAAALPVVVTKVGGTPEVIQHEQNGLMVAARDSANLTDAFVRLAGDRGLGERLGATARTRIETQFATKTMRKNYLLAYGFGEVGTDNNSTID